MLPPWTDAPAFFGQFDGFRADTGDALIANLEQFGLRVRDADFGGSGTPFFYRYNYVTLPGVRMTAVDGTAYQVRLDCPGRSVVNLSNGEETVTDGASRPSAMAPLVVSHYALDRLDGAISGGPRLRMYFDAAELAERMQRWSDGLTFRVDLSNRAFADDDWRGQLLKSSILQAASALSAIPDGSMRMASYLNVDDALLRVVALCFSDGFASYARNPKPAACSRQVRRADEFITANALMPVSVSDIARAAGVSDRSLQLAFRRDLDCTPMQRLRERRLMLAFAALERSKGDDTIAAIAAAHGFANAGDFSVLFRKRFGVAPSEVFSRRKRV